MKRIVIALVLGSLLALSVASVAAAKQVIVGQLTGEVFAESASTLTVIAQGSRLSARLRAIDAVLYPYEVEFPECWADPVYLLMYQAGNVMIEIADTDGYYLAYF